jgi:phospholipid/cholesterol/gamma-HCH transport system substrate-binding protein
MSLEARVGVFVIVSLLVLGATVYSVRTTQDVRGQVVYTTSLRHAGGIASGTPVLFAGIRVGQVASVGPLPADPTRIEITFAVKAGTPVNEESIARVGGVTLMSSPTLFLTGGSNNARRLAPGEVVPSQEAIGANEIAARLATVADNANDLMTLLKQEVPAVTGEARAVLANLREISGTKNQKQVENILAELNTMLRRESPKIAHITDRMTALTGHADELVVSVQPLVAKLDHTVTNVSTTVDAVREPLTKDLAELQRTLESARALIGSVQRVVGDNEGDIHQTMRSLRMASENVRLLSETLKERPWNLIRTTQPPERKVPR